MKNQTQQDNNIIFINIPDTVNNYNEIKVYYCKMIIIIILCLLLLVIFINFLFENDCI